VYEPISSYVKQNPDLKFRFDKWSGCSSFFCYLKTCPATIGRGGSSRGAPMGAFTQIGVDQGPLLLLDSLATGGSQEEGQEEGISKSK